jgi:hypothetical protein
MFVKWPHRNRIRDRATPACQRSFLPVSQILLQDLGLLACSR